MNSNAVLLDDPQSAREWFLAKERHHPLNRGLGGGVGLIGQAKDDNTGMRSGRIGDDVREVEVEGDEGPLFASANIDEPRIRVTAQSFIGDGMNVMVGAEQVRQRRRQILVELELHATSVATTLSRASSAAYAIAAVTSSRCNGG